MEELPVDHRALVLSSTSEPPVVKEIPVPKAGPGSVVVKVLCANVLPYSGDVYSGRRKYPFPLPLVIGSSAVARVAAIGSDTTSLRVADLVFVDLFIHGRDNHAVCFLPGLHQGETEESAKLMANEWRDYTYAEYAKVPLENCTKVSNSANHTPEELAYLGRLSIPFGGFRDINLEPGSTVIVAPATGHFGGAAVEVALAMGAKVIAAGRNAEKLKSLSDGLKAAANGRLRTVQLTGDVATDTAALGPADAWQDWSPPGAAKSPHIEACLMALKPHGKASLMGGILGKVEIPYIHVMHKSLTLKGRWMYEPDALRRLVDMVETGLLKLDRNKTVTFPLEDWQKAFDTAAAQASWGEQTLLKM